MLLIGSEIQFGQLLFNCASSGFPNAAAYATLHVSSSCLLFWCALLALVSSALKLGDPTAMKMLIVETGLHLWDAPTRRLLVHN